MIALNMQPIEKVVHREDGAVDIVDIWYTIQGEGPLNGTPAVFIRTAGCWFACRSCDTNYTTGRKLLTLEEIVAQVQALPACQLVVLTGGEPLRQDICPMIHALNKVGYHVQIETSGGGDQIGLHYFSPKDLTVVCSPKAGHVHKDLLPIVHSYKYVLEAAATSDLDGLPTSILGNPHPPARPPANFPKDRIYLQPCDHQDPLMNEENTKATVQSCLKYGYRLCLQIHKLVGLA